VTTPPEPSPRVAVFVSPHGFGHAARASAVMEAAHRLGGAHFEVFTTAPEWFFSESVAGLFHYHPVRTDVGFVQSSALRFDLEATCAALRNFLPFDDAMVDQLAETVVDRGCSAVLCDIAPLGVAVAARAGLPSVLVENFTWSWLYEPLWAEVPELEEHARTLDHWVARADRRIQTEPLCARDGELEVVPPIARPVRRTGGETRRALGIPEDRPLIVVTMGGYGETLPALERLHARSDLHFLVTGGVRSEVLGNVHLFDNATPLYMPDVLRAADAVVAKLGYGTVAEVWHEGLPYAYVTRDDFREMPPLARFADRHLASIPMTAADYLAGVWIDRVDELSALPRRPRPASAADQVARRILEDAGYS
jgi:UDP:flavonoid glycosyltransferase YjiC (YdhE family)